MDRIAARIAPYTLTVLRVVVGLTMLLHGLPKLGGFGGFTGFVGQLGFPAPQLFAALVVVAELGGALLLVGLATRWAALLIALEMVVTTLRVKLPHAGFIAPPNAGAGAELDLLIFAGALVLVGLGPGALALDRVLRPRIA